MVRLCFVCLGNICRSPTAEAVMKQLLASEGLDAAISIDSAGTCAHHIGESPDARSTEVARARGVHMSGAARQFRRDDLSRFDYVLAMDLANFRELRALATSEEHRGKIHLMRSFDADSPPEAEVPDPYYGGDAGFENVLDICFAACEGLLERLRVEHGLE